jgi:hypothetical protein
MFEKTLDDILCVPGRIATTTEECVERRPVSFAKSSERFRRSFLRTGPRCLQDDSPMRRLERRTAFLQRSWNGFRRNSSILERFVLRDKRNAAFGKQYVSCLGILCSDTETLWSFGICATS